MTSALLIPAAIGAGVALFSLAKNANTADKMSVDVADIIYKGISNWTLKLGVVIDFTNPTANTLKLSYILLDVFVDGTKIATLQQRRNVEIKPKQTTRLNIPAQISLKKILINYGDSLRKLILNIIKQGGPKTLEINGYITVDNINYPYNDKIEL